MQGSKFEVEYRSRVVQNEKRIIDILIQLTLLQSALEALLGGGGAGNATSGGGVVVLPPTLSIDIVSLLRWVMRADSKQQVSQFCSSTKIGLNNLKFRGHQN